MIKHNILDNGYLKGKKDGEREILIKVRDEIIRAGLCDVVSIGGDDLLVGEINIRDVIKIIDKYIEGGIDDVSFGSV